ncbi:MAG: dihydrolipoyl dehydrogenase [Gammaproteobacteria bacterium]|nr:MAG: dihydrolipoyl dehydrogenase [Gammaproteobacteria bacterium]
MARRRLTTDVAIVGAGTAGLAAWREVRKRGREALLIDPGPLGTTCARVGCMPSKLLIEAANAFHRRLVLDEFGIQGGTSLNIDLPTALARVRRLRDGFVAGTRRSTEAVGAALLRERASLLGPDRLAVGDCEVHARRIVLAPGSRPIIPGPWRALAASRLLTTDTLFEQRDLPERMAVLGAGAIGLELAQALARLGIEIHVFDLAPALPAVVDPVIGESLLACLGQELRLHLGAEAELTPTADALRVTNGTVDVAVERALVAVGRRPAIDGLGLETLGVPLDEHGLPPVHPETLQVANLPVFLAGDANAARAILHEAADEGHIAGINAASDSPEAFCRRTPMSIVFTDPNLARVGEVPQDADQGVVIGEVDFSRQGRARAAQHAYGRLRVYAEPKTGRLHGAEMCVPAGEHLVHLLGLAIHRQLSVHDLLGMPFYHPVLEEGLRSALRDAAGKLDSRRPASDLANCPSFDIEALD